MYKIAFILEYKTFIFWSLVFSRGLGCGARRGAACTRRCKCGSRPGSMARALGVRSRGILASNHGVAFRRARAEQDNRKPKYQPFCSPSYVRQNTRFKISPFLQRRTLLCVCGPVLCVCGHCVCVCVLCMCYVWMCVRVCGSVRLCAGTPHFSFLIFFALVAAAAVRIMSSVSHRPSSFQAL